VNERRLTETDGPIFPLADGQRRVLRVIQQYQDATGESPTTSYIARRLNLHHATVQQHIKACYRKGWLRSPGPDGFWCRVS
jgi:Mn-dependent DtxR family transcriptional regulator